MSNLERLVDELKKSKKYRHLYEGTLRNVAAWALARYRNHREANHAARSKLHQVYGAYFGPSHISRIANSITQLPSIEDETALKTICQEILKQHASTAERLSIMETFYADLFALVGPVSSVMDLACGLHPFALPWMRHQTIESYYAIDIDYRIIDYARTFLAKFGLKFEAECRDLILNPPDRTADLAYLLKSVPCLEQVEKGVTVRLLNSIRARTIVVSFPVRSLGKRDKKMAQNYEEQWLPVFENLNYRVKRLAYPTEIFFLLSGAASE